MGKEEGVLAICNDTEKIIGFKLLTCGSHRVVWICGIFYRVF